MKTRQTVNGLRIHYDESNDQLSFEKDGIVLLLMMGEDNLNLLYQMTPYLRYKHFLIAKQNNRCKECGKDLSSLNANMYALHHDPRLGDKGAKYVDFNGSTKNRIICNDCHRKHRDTSHSQIMKEMVETKTQITPIKLPKSSIGLNGTVEQKLSSMGYQNTKGNLWTKGNLQVHLEQTKNGGRDSILIYWRETWKNDHAIVFDYSFVNSPICIVPIKVLFASEFVSNKRSEGYGNSLNWWSQKFPIDHELAQLVLSYKNRWDIIEL